MNYISHAEAGKRKEELDQAKFISVTSDGATDAGICEQEVVFARWCVRGVVISKFVGFEVPDNPDAQGVSNAIKTALHRALGMDDRVLKKKFSWIRV